MKDTIHQIILKSDHLFKQAAIFVIKIYQYRISPFKFYIFGPYCQCRFRVTCSKYAIKMYRSYNFFYATFLSIKRIINCNSFNKNNR